MNARLLAQLCLVFGVGMSCALGACGSDAGSANGGAGAGAGAAASSGGAGGEGGGSAGSGGGGTVATDGGLADGATNAGADAQAGEPDAGAMLPTIGDVLEPGDPGAVDVTLEARADGKLHFISPLIYGMNGAGDIASTRQSVVRLGGNRWTAYNWENNASNAGSDWYFQNDGFLSSSDEPAEPVLTAMGEASSHGAATLVTVPIVDYVSADKNGDGDVRNSGAGYLATRFKQNVASKGAAFASTPDTSDALVYQDEFVGFVKKSAPPGARVLFSLDNEPDLWSSTHAEVHPDPVTYAELWERNQRYAKAIKAAWPEAEVTGFVSYGFNGYVTLQNASDAGGRDFIDFYLDQAKSAEDSDGRRVIDYLDLHWYPEAQGGGTRITEADNSDPVVAARLAAPRSLWDSSYEETSWIRDYVGGPIALLPWLKAKIAAHYPGTKLAFTEWNYGGGDHVSGALAAADVLGIFGREQVALATFWALHGDESFVHAAFRAFRNYDGSNGEFGDVSVPATSSDESSVSFYASLDAADPDRMVLIAVNKAATAKQAGVRIAHPAQLTQADMYVLQGASASLVKGGAVPAVAQNAFRIMLPARSLTVLVPSAQ